MSVGAIELQATILTLTARSHGAHLRRATKPRDEAAPVLPSSCVSSTELQQMITPAYAAETRGKSTHMSLPFAARWEVSSLRWNHGSFVEAAQVRPLAGQAHGDWWVERPVAELPERHLARVQRRWWLASKLTSPVWPALIDAGDEGGAPWAVIESPGRRTEGTFPFADTSLAVRAARGLALGVAEAEAVLLSHFTSPHVCLHPSMLGSDEHGRLRLHLAALDVTADQGFPNTPATWSWTPEALFGQPLTARSNVFALAWLLHLMLSGRSPYGVFAQGRSESAAQEALRALVVGNKLQLALPASLTKLEPVLRRALSASPSQRFASSAAFAEALAVFAPGALTPRATPANTSTLPMPALEPQYEALPAALESRLINATDDSLTWSELAQALDAQSPRAKCLRGDTSAQSELTPALAGEGLQLTWKKGYVRALSTSPSGRAETHGDARVNELTALLQHPSLRFLNELTLSGPLPHTRTWLDALARTAPPGLKRVTVNAIGPKEPQAVDLAFRFPKWTWVWGSSERGLLQRLFGRA